ncbi:hypothetical protein AgCh_027290 [Apium graveolens]
MVRVEESTDGDMVIPMHYAPKDPSEYFEPEKEKVSLDSGLQLILIESLDNVMYSNIVNRDTAKQIWEKIEILGEGTEEVRSNQRRILISQYEVFMAKPKESITDVFERFNKMINDLQLHDKYYEAGEVNLKFFLTLSDHLEQKISAIREGRDLSRITLEGHVIDGSSALIVNESQTSFDEPRSQTPVASTINGLFARKFSNIRVKKPRFFKGKGQSFNKDNNWKEKGKYTSDSKNGYKTGSVDRSKIRCYNCDELGHFATECRKPKKEKKDKAYLELEANWDDSENDEDEEFGNYALMALDQGESSSSKSQLESEKQETELLLVELEAIKQENAYLNNKLKRANEIEAVLREKLEKNEVKLKSFINASELVGQYYEKNKQYANIAIGLDYDALNCKKKEIVKKLIIKQEIDDEDKEKKTAESTQSSNTEEKLMDKQSPKTPVKETKTDDFEEKAGPLVTFGDNSKGFTMGYGNIVSENIVIDDVALIAGLEVNLLSVSQFADKGFEVLFNKEECIFISKKTGEVALRGGRKGSLFVADLESTNNDGICCFYTKELVRDMPKPKLAQVEVCEGCQKWKMKRSSQKSKTVNSISAPLQLIHMDFIGKDETPHIIIEHIKKIEKQAEDHNCVKRLRSDNGTLVEAARTMLQDAKLPTSFREEVVNTACYTQNKYLINKAHGKSPYSIMSKRKPTVKHLHVFGSKCYILKDNSEYVEKFDSKVFEAIFLGYSLERTTYKVYVIDQKKIMESEDVTSHDDKCLGLECLDDNEAEALVFENINTDSDFDGEDEVDAQLMTNEESTEQENHGNRNSSQTPEFDSTNSGGEREEGSSSHTNNEENDEGTSQ